MHKHDTTTITWDVRNVTSCTVSGTNGDSWAVTGTGNPKTSSATRTSSGILGQTIFTLHCTPFTGAGWNDQKATVNIVPIFQER